MSRILYKKLIHQNKKWAEKKLREDPDYFKRLEYSQTPSVLWIGCSDSRVPASKIIGAEAGEIFVHRNIANLIVHSDMNMLSVLDYAVNVIKVKHIIVCGHYDCGGIKMALENKSYGIIDNWILHIKTIYYHHQKELSGIKDKTERLNRLVEINAREQAYALAKTSIVQNAWKKRQQLYLHTWVYSVNSGLIKDLNINAHNNQELNDIFQLNL